MILGAKVASPSFGSGMNEFKINHFFVSKSAIILNVLSKGGEPFL
jgi:hypothetical protein